MGASERAPQMRGMNLGAMRVGAGRTDQEAASARLKKRPRRRKTFVYALDGGGIGEPQITGRAEGFARDNGNLHFFEQELGDFCARFSQRVISSGMRGNIRERRRTRRQDLRR